MLSEKQKDAIRLATRGYAWPGGYPVYMLMGDGGVLCSTCVSREIRLIVDATRPNGSADQQWSCVAVDVNWEDPQLLCDHCGERIESAYADDDKDEATG
ncbi:MAG: hypothetical protein K9L32_01980 [Chromatiaceae bacterium]|nr:hypothetical protein [Chromatiaceae bacterium]MCF8002970.1 hypothetical protein [Chromatiaceae bacterium]